MYVCFFCVHIWQSLAIHLEIQPEFYRGEFPSQSQPGASRSKDYGASFPAAFGGAMPCMSERMGQASTKHWKNPIMWIKHQESPKRARSSDQDLRVRGAATCVVTLKVDFPSWSMAENQHLRWLETDELMNEFPPLFYIVLYFVECSRTYSRARKDIQLLPLSVWTCCAVIPSRIETYECI